MATLAERGRITQDLVLEEISRLQTDWQTDVTQPATDMEIDLFDQRQLKRCWRYVAAAHRCLKPDVSCLPFHGSKKPILTTPTDCANIWLALV
jgi:hypothetical protein